MIHDGRLKWICCVFMFHSSLVSQRVRTKKPRPRKYSIKWGSVRGHARKRIFKDTIAKVWRWGPRLVSYRNEHKINKQQSVMFLLRKARKMRIGHHQLQRIIAEIASNNSKHSSRRQTHSSCATNAPASNAGKGVGVTSNNSDQQHDSPVELQHPPRRARVVICGGGVMGAAVAYHLALAGWGEHTVIMEQSRWDTYTVAGSGSCVNGYTDSASLLRMFKNRHLTFTQSEGLFLQSE